MNKKLLRVLGQMEMGDEASLVCELPRHLLKDVIVDDYGQVDLAGLLTLCKQLSSVEAESQSEFESEFESEFRLSHEIDSQDELNFSAFLASGSSAKLSVDSRPYSKSFYQEEEDFEKSSFWFRMIYDSSLAVDPLSVR